MKSYIATNGAVFYTFSDEKSVEAFMCKKDAKVWSVYMRVPIEPNGEVKLTSQLLTAWIAARRMLRIRRRQVEPANKLDEPQIGRSRSEESEESEES